MRLLALILPLILSLPALAELQPLEETEAEPAVLQPVPLNPQQRYQGMLTFHTPEELTMLLVRADAAARAVNYQTETPVALVLQGEEISLFDRSKYREHKKLVDLAARLDAFNVVDIKACRQWMVSHELSPEDLPPFIELVDDGPTEVQRLQLEGYVSF